MFLTCPACSTRYSIDPTALGNRGRAVRCARCGYKWHQDPPEDQPIGLPDDVMEDLDAPESLGLPGDGAPIGGLGAAPRERSPAPPAKPARRMSGRNLVGWVLLMLLLVSGSVGGYVFREAIVTVWPAANRLYGVLGVPVTLLGHGLELKNVTSEREVEGGSAILMVKGQVTNVGHDDVTLPLIRVALFDAVDRVVQDTLVTPTQPSLAPGQILGFQARLKNPPDSARRMEVTFVAARPPKKG